MPGKSIIIAGTIEALMRTPTYREIGIKIGQRYFGLHNKEPWINSMVFSFSGNKTGC